MRLIRLAVASLSLCLGVAVNAGEITVISGGAIEPGLRTAAAAFEMQTGHQVIISFNTTPQMLKRIGAGDSFDVVIAPPTAIAEFVKTGKVDAGGEDVGRVGSGVAVRPGAPLPAIASADDIKKTVLEADSVVFNRASTGIYFENLLKKMGVWEQVEPKTVRFTTGAEVMKHTLQGKPLFVAAGIEQTAPITGNKNRP
ncbi:MAG: substrate-binding domain-containing protein [Rhodocyclaceae bacterium]|nr:substrate-binding domain-containing protein [Rhodocyclaceae bacterium]